MNKSMKFEDPKYLLSLCWDKLEIYDSSKKSEKDKVIYEIGNIIKIDKPNIEINSYYNDLIKLNKSKTYALIASILNQKQIESIKLKGHKINIMFNDKSDMSVDLLTNEIVDDMNQIIGLIISNYKKSRIESVQKYIKEEEKGLIVFNKSLKYKSKFEENAHEINFSLMKRGKNSFNLDEDDFAFNVIKEFLERETNEIRIGKKILNTDDKMPIFKDSAIVGMRLYGKNNSLVLNNKMDFIKVQQLVNSHNERILNK